MACLNKKSTMVMFSIHAGVVGLSAVNLNGWSLSGRLPAAVFIPPLPWGDTVYIFKGSGKVQLVGVAHGISYVSTDSSVSFKSSAALVMR